MRYAAFLGLAAAGMALAAAPALAQTAPETEAASETAPDAPEEEPASSSAEITVEGERQLDRAEIVDSLGKIATKLRTGRVLPRFYDPVCPHVIGIEPAVAALVEARIRANASALGLREAKADCLPNATLLILEQPREMFEQLIKKRPNLIGDYEVRDRHVNAIRADLKAGLPVVAWNFTDIRADAGIVLTGESAPTIRAERISRLDSTSFLAKASSFLVFDKKRLVDVEATQLADFATVYLLGAPRNPPLLEDLAAPTILTLFRDGPQAAPQQLTDFDRAFLQGSYTMRRNAWTKRLPREVVAAY